MLVTWNNGSTERLLFILTSQNLLVYVGIYLRLGIGSLPINQRDMNALFVSHLPDYPVHSYYSLRLPTVAAKTV